MDGVTKCNITMKEASYMQNLIKNVASVQLLYQGSKHGWKPENFHQRCDFKSPTITLF
jgi:hypothetical protein